MPLPGRQELPLQHHCKVRPGQIRQFSLVRFELLARFLECIAHRNFKVLPLVRLSMQKKAQHRAWTENLGTQSRKKPVYLFQMTALSGFVMYTSPNQESLPSSLASTLPASLRAPPPAQDSATPSYPTFALSTVFSKSFGRSTTPR